MSARSCTIAPPLLRPGFEFEAIVVADGTATEEGEAIHSFIWRVRGSPLTGGYAQALADVQERWLGEDACADSPDACQALAEALGIPVE